MQTDDAGCTTFWVFSYPFCATTLYGTVELVVDAIIFPIFKLLLLKKKVFYRLAFMIVFSLNGWQFSPQFKCSSSITSIFARSITALFIYWTLNPKTKYVFNITLTRCSLVDILTEND